MAQSPEIRAHQSLTSSRTRRFSQVPKTVEDFEADLDIPDLLPPKAPPVQMLDTEIEVPKAVKMPPAQQQRKNPPGGEARPEISIEKIKKILDNNDSLIQSIILNLNSNESSRRSNIQSSFYNLSRNIYFLKKENFNIQNFKLKRLSEIFVKQLHRLSTQINSAAKNDDETQDDFLFFVVSSKNNFDEIGVDYNIILTQSLPKLEISTPVSEHIDEKLEEDSYLTLEIETLKSFHETEINRLNVIDNNIISLGQSVNSIIEFLSNQNM